MKTHHLNRLVPVTAILAAAFGCGGESSSANGGASAGGMSHNGPNRETGGAVTASSVGGATSTAHTYTETRGGFDGERWTAMGGRQQTGASTSPLGGSSPKGGSPSSGGVSTTASNQLALGGQSITAGGSTQNVTTTIAGAGGQAGGNTAGASNEAGALPNPTEPVVCKAPDCCVPLQLEVGNVEIYKVGDSAIANLVVQTTDPAGIHSYWMAYAEISSSWGGKQSCVAERMRGSKVNYMLLSCPAVEPSTKLDCDVAASVQVRLYSSAFNDVQPFDATCEGQPSSPAVTITVPVKCPTCSSSSTPSYQVCDYPEPPIADSTFPRCTTFSQPCHCPVNETTGARVWDCPHPIP